MAPLASRPAPGGPGCLVLAVTRGADPSARPPGLRVKTPMDMALHVARHWGVALTAERIPGGETVALGVDWYP